jgi:Tfp pilus assembly protein PilV
MTLRMTTSPQATRAFTLVETLVAVSVLLLVVVGPLTITARTAKSSSFASEQVVAHFLAQEGLELAQRARDTAALTDDGFSNGPVALPWTGSGGFGSQASGPMVPCFSPTGCGLHLTPTAPFTVAVTDCSAAGSCALNLSNEVDDVARYRHGSVPGPLEPSKFTRVIRFEPVGGATDRQIRVVSEVTWRSGAILAPQRVRLETYLFNIYGL